MRDLARASVIMKGMLVIPTRTVMRGLTTPWLCEDIAGVLHLNSQEGSPHYP